jgi:hypothetical protein
VKGKKAVALSGSLPEKHRMTRACGCGERPWLPMVASSDAGAGRWRRVAPGATVNGLYRRGKKRSRLGRRLRRNRGGVRCGRRHAEEGGGEGNGAWRGLEQAGACGRWGRAAVGCLPHEQGSGAVRVGRPGEGRSWAGPERTMRF